MEWTLLEVQAETDIENRAIHEIVREDLHLRKIESKWVPHALTEVENGHHMQYVIYYIFSKCVLFIHPRAPNTIHFHLCISVSS